MSSLCKLTHSKLLRIQTSFEHAIEVPSIRSKKTSSRQSIRSKANTWGAAAARRGKRGGGTAGRRRGGGTASSRRQSLQAQQWQLRVQEEHQVEGGHLGCNYGSCSSRQKGRRNSRSKVGGRHNIKLKAISADSAVAAACRGGHRVNGENRRHREREG